MLEMKKMILVQISNLIDFEVDDVKDTISAFNTTIHLLKQEE
ncbi:MAG: hypothetical protein R2771_09050 [Saprospiraceae bacterium]